jgi:benzoate-CoA ligase family protein
VDRRTYSSVNLGGLFDRIFLPQRATRPAILCEHRKISYSELREQVLRAAQSLRGLGIAEGDRVAMLLADSPEFIASFIAIISLGAIAVPINLALRREDQLFILKDCGACAAIVETGVAETLLSNRDELNELKILSTESLTGIAEPDGALFHGRATAPSDHDAFILYTSGSTGEAKGAVHSQADIFYTNETFCREVLNLREGDRLFSSSRLPFAYGLGNGFTFPLLNGLTTILCREKPTADVVSGVFRDYRPTIFFGVPVVYRMLLEHHRSVTPLETSSLRLCVSAGEALPAQLGAEWQKTFGVEVLDGIGSTEMLHMFMSNHEREVRYGSSGKLLNGYEARLIDHEAAPTKPGEVGNLWIRGGSAASRYWQRPETSAETFADGWVRTGDLYRQDQDGFWWHMGRSDDCFKPTGQWVSPVEVEGVLLRHDDVRAAAVVEGFDKDGLSCVCAFIVAETQSNPSMLENNLRAHCEWLPRFKQPRHYIFVDDLPYTATGKLQRFKLRELLWSPKSNVQVPRSS